MPAHLRPSRRCALSRLRSSLDMGTRICDNTGSSGVQASAAAAGKQAAGCRCQRCPLPAPPSRRCSPSHPSTMQPNQAARYKAGRRCAHKQLLLKPSSHSSRQGCSVVGKLTNSSSSTSSRAARRCRSRSAAAVSSPAAAMRCSSGAGGRVRQLCGVWGRRQGGVWPGLASVAEQRQRHKQQQGPRQVVSGAEP